ncbi:calcium/sodium antiporter [Candidatus Gracilibacteria bacterium]|nr:calcium/sodium antiporter [Candidatus Gracilibacteria bacterium]
MQLLLWSLALMVSLTVLVKSADYFTQGAENIGKYFGLSSFIIGATIVAIGGSMPEIVTSLLATFDGKSDFAVDNIIGSNIANILLIGGVAGICAKNFKVDKELINIDLPFFFFSTALFLYFISDGVFTVGEGVITLSFLGVFIAYTLSLKPKKLELLKKKYTLSIRDFLLIIGGVVGIYFGAKYTIASVYTLAELLSVPSAIVTIFAVAVGTSLPELIISVQAVRANNYGIALGNIFGSNTFNALAVSGIPALFGSLSVSSTSLSIGIPFLAFATLGFIFTTLDNKIARWEAIALLVVYVAFIGKIVGIL